MKTKILLMGAIILSMIFSSMQAYALKSKVFYNNEGTVWSTGGLDEYATYGSDMDGMAVTAYFEDGTFETAYWGTIGDEDDEAGAAQGASFTLSETGHTMFDYWNLSTTLAISRIRIDAGAGDTVFDTVKYHEETAGSADGKPFSPYLFSSLNLDIEATYSGQVALTGESAVGDLYRYLDIEFVNDGGFGPNSSLKFKADTDNLKLAGDLTATATPEPASFLLVAFGLLGLAGMRKRSLKK